MWSLQQMPANPLTYHMEMNESENTIYQHLLDIAKAMQGGKFIALNAQIHKEERS